MQRCGVPVHAPRLTLPHRALYLVDRVHQNVHVRRALLDALQPPEDAVEGEVGVPVIEPNGRPREGGLHPSVGVVVGTVLVDEIAEERRAPRSQGEQQLLN